MKTLKFLIGLILIAWLPAKAQSYERLEKRFVKQELTKEDSLAFTKQGIQKARSLFLRGNTLYLSNQHKPANQAYIQSTLPRSFQPGRADSLQIDSLFALLPHFQLAPGANAVEFKALNSSEFLSHLVSTNLSPPLELDLILVLQEKSFGSQNEKIWQVFLANPLWEDFPSSQ